MIMPSYQPTDRPISLISTTWLNFPSILHC